MKLHNPERLFGLDEKIDRRLPRVRSLHLIREDGYGGWLKCIACIVCVAFTCFFACYFKNKKNIFGLYICICTSCVTLKS